MMKQEFEKLANIEVTEETYTTVIEPMYSATNLSKQDFIKTLNLKFFKKNTIKQIIVKSISITDRSGCRKTPNGCYYHVEYVELVDIDIASGKVLVRKLSEENKRKLIEQGIDLNLSYNYDYLNEDVKFVK